MEEHFIVSARKYRPQKFEDVVGQSHISDTLKNSIKTNHLAHSFLFCGPRGVGKTTSARILAKTINCKNITNDVEACDQCDSCVSFNQNASFNIHELDAASNNSVDDIRALVEQVRYAPQNGKYKIYIIDEVHMLSQAAFNAFLKTLEEPPSYAIFILATTEKHKIIPTILSRCQIFDFKRISNDDITNHLKGICAKEQIEADELGLQLIAQKADGGLRDALSMFDRLTSLRGNVLKYEDVLESLNVLDYDYFFKISDAIVAENYPFVLNTVEEILYKGFEPESFIQGLAEHFRNLLVCKEASTVRLLHLSGAIEQRYLQQAALISDDLLINYLNLAAECDVQYKTAKNKRLLVEITLIKMCYIQKIKNSSLIGTHAEQKKNSLEPKKVEENSANIPEQKIKDKPQPSAPESIKIPTSLKDIQERVRQEVKVEVKETLTVEETISPVYETKEKVEFPKAWENLLVHLQGKSKIVDLLREMNPIEKDGNIHLMAVNNIHKRMIDAEVASIQKFLRVEMQAEELIVETIQVKDEEREGVFKNVKLNPKEQLEKMIEYNPIIKSFIERLGIELEY
ncbi:MAG: DNA polymerase III subunit gamma/tau [Chitinophagales bacterium]|nr:DNA polymerase III subunit gamma/tau [Chitinophagales bacterium]